MSSDSKILKAFRRGVEGYTSPSCIVAISRAQETVTAKAMFALMAEIKKDFPRVDLEKIFFVEMDSLMGNVGKHYAFCVSENPPNDDYVEDNPDLSVS